MVRKPLRAVVAGAIAWTLLSGTASAQTRFKFTGPKADVERPAAGVTIGSAGAQSQGGGPSAVGTGALIGAGAALGVTALAASRYGENEGGGFCGLCMVQWSLVTVPAGAGAGAIVGYLVRAARNSPSPSIRPTAPRRVTTAPVFLRRGGGVFMTATF